MNVTRRLQLNTAVSVLTVFVVALVLFTGLYRINRAFEELDITDEILNGLFQRTTLLHNYVMNGNERAKEQWFAEHAQIGRLLGTASEKFKGAEQKSIVDEMIADHAGTEKLFTGIVENREKRESGAIPVELSQAIENRQITQVNIRLYGKILNIGELRAAARQRVFSELTYTGGAVVLFVVIAAALAAISSWTLGRTIADRISMLRKGLSVIGQGDLDHRIHMEGNDEFAGFSKAFDNMTRKLSLTYHELRKEIAERRQAEEALRESKERVQASLVEKEVLLREIHHRVKNNMQVISSLVSLQADELGQAAMGGILNEVANRVRSMAMVHEKLYESSDLARIDFADYAGSLLAFLWRAHGSAASKVRLDLALSPVFISVNDAVPCGLILNELVSNALKHAFNGRKEGTVTVTLESGAGNRVRLIVRDDGVGFAPGVDWQNSRSLGLRLVQMLTRQLHADLDVSSGNGTAFRIEFERTTH